ncbi:MAG TPA: methyltransferase domain-containing protein [Hyphomicrobiales bacterium]|jgi:SAM-dependent methyltransferase
MKFLGRTILRSMGKFPRECPLCGHRGKFLGYGYPYVCDILCPKCGSLERHRLLTLAAQTNDFFRNRDVLHFAPERSIANLVLSQKPRSYTTADLFARGVDLKEDIEALTIKDASFDVVICLHVLEHVNDRKAARELFRVLRPGGVLLAMFPIVEGWEETFENPAVKSEKDRLLYFGQHDHARFFGRDARKRLAAPGFIVEEYTAMEPHVSRYGLSRGEKIFVCSRPPAMRSAAPDHSAINGLADENRPASTYSVPS